MVAFVGKCEKEFQGTIFQPAYIRFQVSSLRMCIDVVVLSWRLYWPQLIDAGSIPKIYKWFFKKFIYSKTRTKKYK